MAPRHTAIRRVAGILFVLAMLQWLLRLGLAAQRFWRSGLAGVKAEVMDASIHLTRNFALSWEGALVVQGLLILLTVVSGLVYFRRDPPATYANPGDPN